MTTDGTHQPVVDAHQHIWDLDTVDQPWIDPVAMAPIACSFTLDDARTVAAVAGVRHAVIVQTVPQHHETPLLLAQAVADPYVAGVVGWVDLSAPDVAEQIARLRAAAGGDRLVGIRHLVQDEPDPCWLDRPAVRRGLGAVGAAGLAYDLLVHPPQLPAAVRVARDLPGVRFVLDHLGKPPIAGGDLREWAHALRSLGALDNVVAKLSGLITEADLRWWRDADLRPCIDLALAVFGPARLAYGSDWPVCRLAAGGYRRWWFALAEMLCTLSPAERAAVYAGTATTVYNLQIGHTAH
ncbi:MAG: amidohydrolase family protein [Micromonosporaceae bacterium]|nr:amidohydrolase family protein [Micromonosporaceae bacterium]